MADIRERVARAICDSTPNDFDATPKWLQANYRAQADAALSACGYQEMRDALADVVEYMTARSDWEIGGDDDSHAAYATGVVNRARRILNPDDPFNPDVRSWCAENWARAKADQERGRQFIAEFNARAAPSKSNPTEDN